MIYTPEHIVKLEPGEVFVFGSNSEGKHGAGAAKKALDFGARYGQADRRQGQTYAIVTKDLAEGQRSVSLEAIGAQVLFMYGYAYDRPWETFLVTKLGCGLGGYKIEEVKEVFKNIESFRPDNVVLPKEFAPLV